MNCDSCKYLETNLSKIKAQNKKNNWIFSTQNMNCTHICFYITLYTAIIIYKIAIRADIFNNFYFSFNYLILYTFKSRDHFNCSFFPDIIFYFTWTFHNIQKKKKNLQHFILPVKNKINLKTKSSHNNSKWKSLQFFLPENKQKKNWINIKIAIILKNYKFSS